MILCLFREDSDGRFDLVSMRRNEYLAWDVDWRGWAWDVVERLALEGAGVVVVDRHGRTRIV